MEKRQQDQMGAFLSHGRGHRFNPYSAHHFSSTYPAPIGTERHRAAPAVASRRGLDVEGIAERSGAAAQQCGLSVRNDGRA